MSDKTHQDLADLIARCSLKDQTALAKLYQRLGPYLNGVAYRILQSDNLCKEVLQEAFIQIWQNASSYRPDISNPLTWITSIVRYRALDIRDRESKHSQRTVDIETDTVKNELIDGSPAPYDDLEQHDSQKQLNACLSLLNDKVSKSLKLAYLYGYSREEIAQKLESNANTVKSWLRRGAVALKACLEKSQGEVPAHE